MSFSAVTPHCGLMPFSGLEHEVYDTTGFNTSPADAAAYQNFIDTFGIPANLIGSGNTANINGSTNPFSAQQDKYLTIFKGFINISEAGSHIFAVDGDDAIEFRVNGSVLSTFYGLHGTANNPVDSQSITLDVGFHEIEFRHHERTGGSGFDLYMQAPSDTSLEIAPASVFFNCAFTPPVPPSFTPASLTCPTPAPGLFAESFDKTGFGHPNNATEYQTLVDNFAIPANSFGSGVIANINGSGNPFGTNSDYLLIFKGFFEATEVGFYEFAVDGDDAIELRINGDVISTFYGGHGNNGGPVDNTIVEFMQTGFYEIEFRHEEVGGGDNYFLYSRSPSGGTIAIW